MAPRLTRTLPSSVLEQPLQAFFARARAPRDSAPSGGLGWLPSGRCFLSFAPRWARVRGFFILHLSMLGNTVSFHASSLGRSLTSPGQATACDLFPASALALLCQPLGVLGAPGWQG